MSEVKALIESFPSLQYNEKTGKVTCSLTGHEMPCKKEAIRSYLVGKKFQKTIERQDKYYVKYLPHLAPAKGWHNRHLLHCKLTNRHVNKIKSHVERHVNGRKFKKALAKWEECEKTGKKYIPPKGKKIEPKNLHRLAMRSKGENSDEEGEEDLSDADSLSDLKPGFDEDTMKYYMDEDEEPDDDDDDGDDDDDDEEEEMHGTDSFSGFKPEVDQDTFEETEVEPAVETYSSRLDKSSTNTTCKLDEEDTENNPVSSVKSERKKKKLRKKAALKEAEKEPKKVPGVETGGSSIEENSNTNSKLEDQNIEKVPVSPIKPEGKKRKRNKKVAQIESGEEPKNESGFETSCSSIEKKSNTNSKLNDENTENVPESPVKPGGKKRKRNKKGAQKESWEEAVVETDGCSIEKKSNTSGKLEGENTDNISVSQIKPEGKKRRRNRKKLKTGKHSET